MIWHLIAAFVVGLAFAGVALFLRKISGRRLPKWIIPVFAGLGMFSYQIYTEYEWFEHKKLRLPENSIVVASEAPGSFWRPWTFMMPMTSAFTVLDAESVKSRSLDNQVIKEFMLYRFEKQHVDRVRAQGYVLNCSTRELLPISGERELDFSRRQMLSQGDALLIRVCE